MTMLWQKARITGGIHAGTLTWVHGPPFLLPAIGITNRLQERPKWRFFVAVTPEDPLTERCSVTADVIELLPEFTDDPEFIDWTELPGFKKKLELQAPIRITVNYLPSSDRVQLLTGKQAFKYGGQITLIGNDIESAAGSLLGDNVLYGISKGGRGISPLG